ncbi:MAG: saccharopine dehydrogenase NADP-binding domain-containing protein [Myxococcota bacterium]|nr:saccharopine dehydrogenase NADP-binding domain-containing protein [Myxococcota bacterium]
MTRTYDLVVFGASGFTGRLVAEHIARSADKPRWAIAGRNREKLEALGFGVPVLVADAHDRPALDAIARATKVVCTTAGPYAKYGSDLLAACADAGTHYCDLTGEVQWLRRMIDAHHERARETGARIVNSCGYDSIPSDLGTWALQQEFTARYGHPASSVLALYGETSGGLSGGTVASGLQTATEAGEDRAVRKILANPYALDPDPTAARPAVRDESSIGWEPRLKMFTAPFVMAPFNTRIVRRGHALAGFPWGPDFRYREVMSTPGSARGLAMAVGFTGGLGAIAFALKRPKLRAVLAKRAPQPGEGPSAKTRERGHWKVRFVAEDGIHQLIYVAADRADPGYGSTAKMLGESTLCLALDPLTSEGGCITPSVAMGAPLLARLQRAGLTFGPAS